MYVQRGTTIQPLTGIVRLPDGRAYNYDGTPYVANANDIDDGDDSVTGGGGCGTGAFGAVSLLALAAAYRRRKAA